MGVVPNPKKIVAEFLDFRKKRNIVFGNESGGGGGGESTDVCFFSLPKIHPNMGTQSSLNPFVLRSSLRYDLPQ